MAMMVSIFSTLLPKHQKKIMYMGKPYSHYQIMVVYCNVCYILQWFPSQINFKEK